ncbi:hypothetical protein JCM11641_007611 [Rhodosporidiobolus odoratus]
MTSTLTVKTLLHAANLLLGLSHTPPAPSLSRQKPSLASVLANRLDAYSALATTHGLLAQERGGSDDPLTEDQLRGLTAEAAVELLDLFSRLARRLPSLPSSSSSTSTAATPPLFGVKDTKILGMLAGIAGRWGIAPWLEEVVLPPQAGLGKPAPSKISEVPDDEPSTEVKCHRLIEAVQRVLRIVNLHDDVEAKQPRSEGEKQLLNVVVPQLLFPLVGGLVELNQNPWARDGLERVFRSNPATVVMQTLLPLLSMSRSAIIRNRLTGLLTSQLLRAGGVRSLLIVVIGTGGRGAGDDELDTKKAEMVRKLLSAVPAESGLEGSKAHLTSIVTQLLAILHSAVASTVSTTLAQLSSAQGKGKSAAQQPPPASAVPVPVIRAASYVLAHFVVSNADIAAEQTVATLAKPLVLRAMQEPLLPCLSPTAANPLQQEGDEHPIFTASQLYSHLTLLSLFTLYSPPLPPFLHTLAAPILPALLSLSSHLQAPPLIVASPSPAADALRTGVADETRALLATFARAVELQDGVKEVGKAVEAWEAGEVFGRQDAPDVETGEGAKEYDWTWGDDGAPSLSLVVAARSHSPLPFDEAEPEADEPDLAALQLRVQPDVVVDWLKEVDRRELSAGLFLRWLDEVKVLQSAGEGGLTGGLDGAKRAVTRLSLVLRMVEVLSSSILTSPDEIIAFVAHALAAAVAGLDDSTEASEVAKHEVDGGNGGEEEMLGTGLGKDEMASTAVTLLLAVLEANPNLSDSNTPLLPVIASQLTLLAKSSPSPIIAPLAREAKMVLQLRRASSSFEKVSPTEGQGKDDPLAQSRETYREALKLLQDPLLPVRAQGLHLLRTLVLDKETALLSTDPALLPAVLDVFASALEEEDSFLYLNAVQGLSSLVDVFGKQVIGRLMELYVGARRDERKVREVGMGEKGKRELDKRLRVGETLVQVIQRAGEALAALVDVLLPPLLLTLRTSTLPIPLRASSLTILATCVETAPTALVPHAELLADACVSLLQIETVPVSPKPRTPAVSKGPATTKAEESKKTKGKGVLIEDLSLSSSSSDDEEDSDDTLPPPQPPTGKDGRPRRPEEMPDPTSTHSKHPTLRRSALVFLASLFRTVARQAHERREREVQSTSRVLDGEGFLGGRLRMPGEAMAGAGGMMLMRERRPASEGLGTMIGAETLVKARRVLRYVRETDEDGLVRHQAGEVLEDLEDS